MREDSNRIAPLDQLEDFKVAEGEPDVRGWDVVSSDGKRIGEVHELLVDTTAMKVRYLDVDLDEEELALEDRDRHVLVPIGFARLDEENDKVFVDNLRTADVTGLPAYGHGPVTRDLEATVEERFTRGAAGAPGGETRTTRTEGEEGIGRGV